MNKFCLHSVCIIFAYETSCTMKNKTYLSLLIIMHILLVGCHQGGMQKRLSEIDRLVDRELKDTTAYNMLKKINTADLRTEEDSAYYYLLKTQILYRMYMPIKSDSMINVSVKYYEKHDDTEKLARSYYYKGAVIYDLDNTGEAVVNIKKSETIAQELNDHILLHKIFQRLTFINTNAQEYEKAIEYAKKQYEEAKHIGNEEYIASALIDMGVSYTRLNHRDSANYCLAEYQKFVDKVNPKELAYYYTTLGEVHKDSDPELAKAYFIKALQYRNLPKTYKFLADLYLKEGDSKKAKELWKKGFRGKELSAEDCCPDGFAGVAGKGERLQGGNKDSKMDYRLERQCTAEKGRGASSFAAIEIRF